MKRAGVGALLIRISPLFERRQSMKSNSFAVAVCAVIGSSAIAQSSLEKLEAQIAKETLPVSDAGYLGLVGDAPADGSPGIEVISVKLGGPAAAAGIQRGDRILAINRKVIADVDEMGDAMSGLKTGDKPTFEVARAGRRLTVEVTLGKRPTTALKPGDATADVSKPLPVPRRTAGRAVLGINVFEVTEPRRREHKLAVLRGALIRSIRAGSPADRAGLQIGHVIVAVDGRRVDVPADLVNHLALYRPGDKVELSYYESDRLMRQTVELDGTTAPPPAAIPAPSLLPEPRPKTADRPVLRHLEGLLDRLAPPTPAPAPAPRAASELEALSRQVELLQSQVDQLQQRVRELEDADKTSRD